MNEAFKRRQLITVADAAELLSENFGGKFTWEDIYQYGLNGQLTLSVHFPHETFARRARVASADELIAENCVAVLPPIQALRLSEEQTDICGIRDLAMIGGERIYVTNILASEGRGTHSEKDNSNYAIILREENRDYLCLVENKGGETSVVTEWPETNYGTHHICVRPKALDDFIKSKELEKYNENAPNTVNVKVLPRELRLAISTFYEFWHEKPEDKNPASTDDIISFLSHQDRDTLSNASIERILTIAKPEEARRGGAPKSSSKYKGKSKEN